MVVGDDVAGRENNPATATYQSALLVAYLDHYYRILYPFIDLAGGHGERHGRQPGNQD
jgi:hypothetical protein